MRNTARGTAWIKNNGNETKTTEHKGEKTIDRHNNPEAATEIATYIALLTAEMGRMAGMAKLDTLAYFLAMARLEAEMISHKLPSGPVKLQ